MPTRAAISLVLALAASAAAAQPIPPGGIPDFVGPRTLALSSTIGAAAANDGIYVNPASIASRKRYSAELIGYADRRGSENADRFYGGSVVDSQTTSIAAGVSYLRDQGEGYEGNVFHLALAGAVAQDLHLGVTGKLFTMHGNVDYQSANLDAGIFWQVVELLSIGVVGYDLVPGGNGYVAPTSAGAGVAIGSDRSFQMTAEWLADFDRAGAGKVKNRYSAGAEALLWNLVPVRAGFMKDDILGTNWWSAGDEIVTPSGAFDIGYKQSTRDPSARTVAASIKFFIPQ